MLDSDKLSTTQQDMPDKELVVLFKEGSQWAFEKLYARYKKQLIYLGKIP